MRNCGLQWSGAVRSLTASGSRSEFYMYSDAEHGLGLSASVGAE